MFTIDQYIVEWLQNKLTTPKGIPFGNLLLCIIALVLCVLLVGLIGFEREKRGRSAGLRTHLLVGVGSTILMIISIYGFPMLLKADGTPLFSRDVARLAAQIITGVGFLGAGAIIHSNSGIKGLTTAGTIWASMAIGLACGSFNFVLALVGTLLIILVLTAFKKIEVRVNKKTPTIVLTTGIEQPVLAKLNDVCAKNNCTMHHFSISKVEDSKPELIEVTFQVDFGKNGGDANFLIAQINEAIKPTSIHLLSHI